MQFRSGRIGSIGGSDIATAFMASAMRSRSSRWCEWHASPCDSTTSRFLLDKKRTETHARRLSPPREPKQGERLSEFVQVRVLLVCG